VSLSFCSGYLRVNLLIIRCFDPDSIALINPLAELVEPEPVVVVEKPLNAGFRLIVIVIFSSSQFDLNRHK
jgi:hypothetical protein